MPRPGYRMKPDLRVIPAKAWSLTLGERFFAKPVNEAENLTIEVRARSNQNVYLAHEEGNGSLVFSTYPLSEIFLGDRLFHPHWDDREGRWLTVRNVTQNKSVCLFSEDWSMSLKSACALLCSLGSPSQIITIDERAASIERRNLFN